MDQILEAKLLEQCTNWQMLRVPIAFPRLSSERKRAEKQLVAAAVG